MEEMKLLQVRKEERKEGIEERRDSLVGLD